MKILFASLVFLFSGASLASLDERIQVVIEEPVNFGTYAGISNLRGYAVSPEGIGNFNHQVFIDGEFAFYLGTYGERADVGAAFPSYPGSDTGGFSMAFNYKSLSPGQHHVRVLAYDNAGNFNDATATFTVQKFESEFITDDSAIDISGNEDIEVLDGQGLRIRGARIEGKEWDFTLRWDRASQDFKTEDISASGGPSFCPQPGNPACNTTGGADGSGDSGGSSDTTPTPADCSVMDGRYTIHQPGIIIQKCSGADCTGADYADYIATMYNDQQSDLPDKYYDVVTDSCASVTLRPVELFGSPTLSGYAWASGLEVVKLTLTSNATSESFERNIGCLARDNQSLCDGTYDDYAEKYERYRGDMPWRAKPVIQNFWFGNEIEKPSDCRFIPPGAGSTSEANAFDVVVDRGTDVEGAYSIYVSYDVCVVGYYKKQGNFGLEENEFTALLRYRFGLCPPSEDIDVSCYLGRQYTD